MVFVGLTFILALAIGIIVALFSRKRRYRVASCAKLNLGNALSAICHAALNARGDRTIQVQGWRYAPDGFEVPGVPVARQVAEQLQKDVDFVFGDMIHENRPAMALQAVSSGGLRDALLNVLGLPGKARDDGVAVVYLRCSDVPQLDNEIYELIEHDWYLRALERLPACARRRVQLRICTRHPDICSSSAELCAAYAHDLRDFLTSAGYACELLSECGDLLGDFRYLCASAALVVGGTGGSFGFWAAALSPPETHAVLPSSRSPRFCELGAPAESRWGNKCIVRAERLRHQSLRSLGIALDDPLRVLQHCRNVRRPSLPVYDGRVVYINRAQDASRREHMERSLAAHGLHPTRFEPAHARDAVTSLTLSHLRILQFAATCDGWMVVCEDDAVFQGDDVLPQLRAFAAQANMFAYAGICMHDGRESEALCDCVRGRCSHAYLVCPEGAAYLAWILTSNGYVERGEHIDVVMERHVCAPLLRPEMRGTQTTHRGIAYQGREAAWYSSSMP